VNPEQKPAAAPRENQMALFGVIVVLAGFLVILVGLFVVILNYKTSAEAMPVFGILTTIVGALGGAVFGVAFGLHGTGSANKERKAAEEGKDAAHAQALRFAAYMDPEVAKRLVD